MKDNRGATLVELLVGIAVAAVVAGLVGTFLIFSTRTYGKVTEEADMQESAQILLSQLNQYIIDTDGSLRYFVDTSEGGSGTEVLSDDLYSGGGELAEKRLDIYKNLEDGTSREVITWRQSTGELTYRKEKIDTAGNVVSEITEQQLASHISSFSVDLTETADLRQVDLALEIEQEGRSYAVEAVVYLRNQAAVNAPPDAVIVPEPVVSSVLNVKVLPQTVTLRPGSRKTFLAVVYGTNSPSQEVTWSLEGNTSPLTILNPSTGVLWVSANEKSTSLTVRATSVQDPTKSAAALVTVLQDKKLSLGTVRKYWLYQDADMYLYGRVSGTLTGSVTWECRREDGSLVPASEGLLESDAALEAMNARVFHGMNAGTYTVTVKGTVDGDYYEDTVTIEVIDRTEYNTAGNGTYVRFAGKNEMHYWVQPGETIYLSTEILNDALGTERSYEFEEFGGLTADSYTYGSYGGDNESLWVKIGDTALPGDIRIKAVVRNDWNMGYDTVTVHVAYPYAYPYLVEAVNIPSSSNYFWERVSVRGSVKLADSTDELTDLSGGIEGLVAQNGGYDRQLTGIAGWKDGVWDLTGVTHLDLDGSGTVNSSGGIDLGGILVSEGNLSFSSNNTIRTTDDTVIYVKGDHTLSMTFDKLYFDGIIYAPEGTVRIAVNSGFCRGVIIAKNVEITEYGSGCFSVMDKESVMKLVNSIKK